jgi:hypothetical protein
MYIFFSLSLWFTIIYICAFVLFAEAVIFLFIAGIRQLTLWRQLFSILPFGAAMLSLLSPGDDTLHFYQTYQFYHGNIRLLSYSGIYFFQLQELPFIFIALIFPIIGCILCMSARK